MTEADSIIRDPNVALEFTRQIFPAEVPASMLNWSDFKVFKDGIHNSLKGLYTSYEVGMRLRAAQKEIDHKDGRIRNLERRLAEAEQRTENEARKVRIAEFKLAGSSPGNTRVTNTLAKQVVDRAIADRDTANAFVRSAIESTAFEKGFHEGRRVGKQRAMEQLADCLCQFENRGYKHGWANALRAAGVGEESALYRSCALPFEVYDVAKSDDEGGQAK